VTTASRSICIGDKTFGSWQARIGAADIRSAGCARHHRAELHQLRDLHRAGKRRMMAWLDGLMVRRVERDELEAAGIDPRSTCSANTPAELQQLLTQSKETH